MRLINPDLFSGDNFLQSRVSMSISKNRSHNFASNPQQLKSNENPTGEPDKQLQMTRSIEKSSNKE